MHATPRISSIGPAVHNNIMLLQNNNRYTAAWDWLILYLYKSPQGSCVCAHISPSAGTWKKTEYIISRCISFIYIFGPPAEQWIDHNQTHTPLEYYYYECVIRCFHSLCDASVMLSVCMPGDFICMEAKYRCRHRRAGHTMTHPPALFLTN